ncbi:hypothetical protein JCM24511_08727 [Saitozyma sp. JCM 24511]|nr:hypothetical protein JCM24511_08727 [Saitozyma sp. JCM 24511]
MHPRRGLPAFLLCLPLAAAWTCDLTASSISYDLSPLSGLRRTGRDSSTPPSTSQARVELDLCGEGIGVEEGVPEEDQCEPGTKVCLRMINHKPPHAERVISVIPFWTTSTPDDNVWTTPMGRKGQEGLKVWVEGPEYAGTKQNLNLTLLCSTSATDPDPTFVSYVPGRLSLEWATPDACPRSGGIIGGGGGGGGGFGFFGFIKFLFWVGLVGLVLYFAIGILYNHQQYSARGWDLVPHRDFWREFPVLVQDLFGHVFNNVRGGGGGSRGGYSSLG